MNILKEAKDACEGLSINDTCEFYIEGNLTSGVCDKVRGEKIICKSEILRKEFEK